MTDELLECRDEVLECCLNPGKVQQLHRRHYLNILQYNILNTETS